MGFGSYDESEQENQEIDTEQMEDAEEDDRSEFEGSVQFEMEDTESAIDKLHKIQGDEDDE